MGISNNYSNNNNSNSNSNTNNNNNNLSVNEESLEEDLDEDEEDYDYTLNMFESLDDEIGSSASIYWLENQSLITYFIEDFDSILRNNNDSTVIYILRIFESLTWDPITSNHLTIFSPLLEKSSFWDLFQNQNFYPLMIKILQII